MKKSVKSFLLALMVLCLSATAGFAANEHASDDIKVTFKATTDVQITTEITIVSTDLKSLDKLPTTIASAPTGISKDYIVNISFDSGVVADPKFSFDIDVAGISVDIRDIYLVSDDKSTGNTIQRKDAINITVDSKDWFILVTAKASDDQVTQSDINVAFALRLNIVDTKSTTGGTGAFKSAEFVLSTDIAGGVSPTSFNASTTKTSESFTLTSDVETVSIDVSSDVKVKDTSVTGTGWSIASKSSTTSYDKYVVTVGSATSADVHFFMTSGDESFDITLKFTVSSSGGEGGSTTAKLDIGTITISDGDDILTSDIVFDSGDISTATSTDYSASLDTAALNITPDSGATGTISTSTAGDEVTIDLTSADKDVAIAGVYFKDSSASTYTADDTYTSSTKTFALGDTSGTYRIVFTYKDSNSKKWYFTAGITYTYSSSSEKETITDDQAEELASADVAKNIATTVASTKVSASDLRSNNRTVYNSLLSSLGLGSLTDEEVTRRVVFMTITGKIKKGQLFGVNLVPVASSTVTTPDNDDYDDMLSASDNAAADFENYFAIDTQSSTLIDVDTNLTVKSELESGYYVVLVTLFGGYKDSSVAVAATGDAYLNGGNNYLSTETITGSNKGSSSGCDAGFGALALLAIVPFIKKIRK